MQEHFEHDCEYGGSEEGNTPSIACTGDPGPHRIFVPRTVPERDSKNQHLAFNSWFIQTEFQRSTLQVMKVQARLCQDQLSVPYRCGLGTPVLDRSCERAIIKTYSGACLVYLTKAISVQHFSKGQLSKLSTKYVSGLARLEV